MVTYASGKNLKRLIKLISFTKILSIWHLLLPLLSPSTGYILLTFHPFPLLLPIHHKDLSTCPSVKYPSREFLPLLATRIAYVQGLAMDRVAAAAYVSKWCTPWISPIFFLPCDIASVSFCLWNFFLPVEEPDGNLPFPTSLLSDTTLRDHLTFPVDPEIDRVQQNVFYRKQTGFENCCFVTEVGSEEGACLLHSIA